VNTSTRGKKKLCGPLFRGHLLCGEEVSKTEKKGRRDILSRNALPNDFIRRRGGESPAWVAGIENTELLFYWEKRRRKIKEERIGAKEPLIGETVYRESTLLVGELWKGVQKNKREFSSGRGGDPAKVREKSLKNLGRRVLQKEGAITGRKGRM